jgi:hypothetical protein
MISPLRYLSRDINVVHDGIDQAVTAGRDEKPRECCLSLRYVHQCILARRGCYLRKSKRLGMPSFPKYWHRVSLHDARGGYPREEEMRSSGCFLSRY